MLLLRLFKNIRTGGFFFVALIALLTFLVSIISHPEPFQWSGMPLYNLFFGELYRIPLLSYFIALLFNLGNSFILIRINYRYSLVEDKTYIPAILYLIIVNAFPSLHTVNPMLVGSLFYLLSFTMIINAHEDPPDSYKIFNASLVLFIGMLFYAKLIWFVPVIWLIILTIRPVSWREMVFPLVAGLFVGVTLFTFYWVFQDAGWKFSSVLRENLSFEHSHTKVHISKIIFVAYILILVLIASANIITRFQSKKIITRNIYQVFLYMFLFSFVFYFLISGFQLGSIYFMAIPLAYLLTSYFQQKGYSIIKEILIWGLIGFAIYVQISAF